MRKTLRTKLIDESRRILGRDVLNPDHLTIDLRVVLQPTSVVILIFDDPDRLEAILDKGVQLSFAGKAHPADISGKRYWQMF